MSLFVDAIMDGVRVALSECASAEERAETRRTLIAAIEADGHAEADLDRGRSVYRLTVTDLDETTGRRVTEKEIERIRKGIEFSTVSEAVSEVVGSVVGYPNDHDLDLDLDNEFED